MVSYALTDINRDLDAQGNSGTPYAYDHIHQINAAVSSGITVDDDHSYSKPGRSLHLDGGGKLTTPADARLDLNEDLFAVIKFRRDNAVSVCTGSCTPDPQPLAQRTGKEELMRKHNGLGSTWLLDLVEDDSQQLRLRARLWTDAGVIAAIADAPIQNEQWYIAGIGIRNGKLELGLDTERKSTPYSGSLAYQGGSSRLIMGDSFHGNLDEIKVGVENTSTALITLDGGALQGSIPLDSNGRATVTISATTAAIQMPQKIGFTGTFQTVAGLQSEEL